MSDPVLAVLKVCFLAVLYLFLARVLRAVWVEIGDGRSGTAPAPAGSAASEPAKKGAPRPAPAPRVAGKVTRKEAARPARLVVADPPEHRGTSFDLGDEVTVGRGAGCAVRVDDTFASQLHARVFRRDGQFYVEDLGSTNGTFLNRKRVSGPAALRRGDRLQVGQTVLELRRDA